MVPPQVTVRMPPLPHPDAELQSQDRGRAALFVMPETIAQRADFLAASRGHRQPANGFLLQARDRGDGLPARVGFTCSKKIGNAVLRNRAKRRLREVARACLPGTARQGWDYVLVGRPDVTISRDFKMLCNDLTWALRKVHR